jgi:hypothetical protein
MTCAWGLYGTQSITQTLAGPLTISFDRNTITLNNPDTKSAEPKVNLHFEGSPQIPSQQPVRIDLKTAFKPGIDLGKAIGQFVEERVSGKDVAEKTLNILPILVQISNILDVQAQNDIKRVNQHRTSTQKLTEQELKNKIDIIIQTASVIQGILDYLGELNGRLDKMDTTTTLTTWLGTTQAQEDPDKQSRKNRAKSTYHVQNRSILDGINALKFDINDLINKKIPQVQWKHK